MKFTHSVIKCQLICLQCDYQGRVISKIQASIIYATDNATGSTANWIDNIRGSSKHKCPNCSTCLIQYTNFQIYLTYWLWIFINVILVIRKDNKSKVLYLRGNIYFGGFHFTSHIISLDQMVWYCDGMTSGARPIQEGFLDQIENLNVSNHYFI